MGSLESPWWKTGESARKHWASLSFEEKAAYTFLVNEEHANMVARRGEVLKELGNRFPDM